MQCTILHESENRIRVHLCRNKISCLEADKLEAYLLKTPGVTKVSVFERTCDAVIFYQCGKRSYVISALSSLSFQSKEFEALPAEHSGREITKLYEEKIVFATLQRLAERLLLPLPIRQGLAVVKAVPYVFKGLKSLLSGRFEVSVLDAAAIAVSIIRGDFNTASSVMYLLKIGELLEEWTHKKSVSDLAKTMSLGVDKAWRRKNGKEVLVSVNEVQNGDEIVVRTGNVVPFDGQVIGGDAMINQSSITGEPLAVRKTGGGYVYAGTVVEEGECVFIANKQNGGSTYEKIVSQIEESEKLKSETENRTSAFADKLVPYTLFGSLLTYLLTRNATKAVSVLMVDFSCALKLSIPLAMLSAMRESSAHSITVKGGKFLEASSNADTIVFDKTGTLTKASPRLAGVVPFGNNDEDELLRTAACLEEHYPHSIANAIVNAALEQNLNHEERHSKVEYVVAHGISSIVDGNKVVIGSYHFVFEDEECAVPDGEQDRLEEIPDYYTHLYMASAGVLSAVFLIEDPLREEASEVIGVLKTLGIDKIVMMTGDSECTAASVAKMTGVDEYYSEVLPSDKAEFIRKAHERGRCVMMIGDGINDTPALSEADVGIAINSGAATAKEISDITISSDALWSLITLRKLSEALMARIHRDYRFIVAFNSTLIFLGVAGLLPPATSAFLHNASTIYIGIKNMTNLLK